jgi:KEOPS complex subunit Cgi121
MRLVEGIARVDDVDGFLAGLDRVATDHGVTVQAFDARYVTSRRHLARAVELADRERERGAGIARERAVEILLYAAGRRQIDRALEMGVAAGETPVVVLVDREGAGDGEDGNDDGAEAAAAAAIRDRLEPATTLGAYDEARVCAFFEVGEAERAATDASLDALVRERVALLVVER